ncbi:MAG: hypothetical protein JXD23_01055 [Spirochaetales bacterium]|nr:hypothetical protein [Spirochaetales bacterium]
MDFIDKWNTNETLLQSYRSIFISFESFLLAVGAIAARKNHFIICTLAIVGIISIWPIWFRVVQIRHRIVDYYKYAAHLPKSKLSKLCTEHEYLSNINQRNFANSILGLKSNWRVTRIKMDLVLPLLFTIVWIILVLYQFGVLDFFNVVSPL